MYTYCIGSWNDCKFTLINLDYKTNLIGNKTFFLILFTIIIIIFYHNKSLQDHN